MSNHEQGYEDACELCLEESLLNDSEYRSGVMRYIEELPKDSLQEQHSSAELILEHLPQFKNWAVKTFPELGGWESTTIRQIRGEEWRYTVISPDGSCATYTVEQLRNGELDWESIQSDAYGLYGITYTELIPAGTTVRVKRARHEA